jgi:hypothetical protein
LAFVVAFVVAELFYKFRSFSLECIAFLGTWAILGVVMSSIVALWIRLQDKSSDRTA